MLLSKNLSLELAYRECKPLLKWAGGKTQLLGELLPKMPKKYARYVEPFIGGGALFFAVAPEGGLIADSNPELINLYRAVAANVEGVIDALRDLKNSEEVFYELRAQDWLRIPAEEAAARTIYLNRTCFNGLYRVNKNGGFNVPYGRYKNPKILDEIALRDASQLLRNTTVELGDYKDVLKNFAKSGDFIFLDPPYLPTSAVADFKRYTKDQFHEKDHLELAAEVDRLHELGCHVVLTNSNHPLVHEKFSRFEITVVQTKRYISCKGENRSGEDAIVNVLPKQRFNIRLVPDPSNSQTLKYPSTRFMGSKEKLLAQIWSVASQFKFDHAVDLFSGSGIVGYMFKANGKHVVSNDYMAMSAVFAKAMIENNFVQLEKHEALSLLKSGTRTDTFVASTFQGLYFTDQDNALIDTLRGNILMIGNEYKRAIAMAALIRACLKKRPRGIFTYVGHRYDDGRKDLAMSFETQFLLAVEAVNSAVFDNGKLNHSRHGDAMTIPLVSSPSESQLVYIDPPYYSPLSDNEYVRRYHFVEGLAKNWKGLEIQEHTLTKKFKSYPTPFSSRLGAVCAFDQLFSKFRESVILVSYSSNSLPTQDEMVALIAKYKSHVEVVPVDYRYSIGNQGHKRGDNKNSVKEFLFVGY